MTQHIERRSAHRPDPHPIPPITDPLGQSWDQPCRAFIELDSESALMTKATFDELAEYSCSQPSGVYPGKMWKRHDGSSDREFLARGGKPTWLLCWFGFSSRGPDWCSTFHRKIILSDARIEEQP